MMCKSTQASKLRVVVGRKLGSSGRNLFNHDDDAKRAQSPGEMMGGGASQVRYLVMIDVLEQRKTNIDCTLRVCLQC